MVIRFLQRMSSVEKLYKVGDIADIEDALAFRLIGLKVAEVEAEPTIDTLPQTMDATVSTDKMEALTTHSKSSKRKVKAGV